MMTRTNIILNDEVVEEAKKLTSLKTKREVIDFALRELVKQLKRKKLLAPPSAKSIYKKASDITKKKKLPVEVAEEAVRWARARK